MDWSCPRVSTKYFEFLFWAHNLLLLNLVLHYLVLSIALASASVFCF